MTAPGVDAQLLALGVSGATAALGWPLLRLLRRRSVTTNVSAVVLVAVLAVVAGAVASTYAMVITPHDLGLLVTIVLVAGAVSLLAALGLGRHLARQSVWADEARERERSLDASRRELVAWVSHDLRTPLAGIRAIAEALDDEVVDDPATVATYHSRLRREADRMTALVDDLFELSRINAGALQLSLDLVSLTDVVSDAVSSAAPVARAKGVRLEAEPDGYPPVLGSEPELGRVLRNLLVNAIRHTPADGTVRVVGGVGDDHAWLAVADGCGGIPEADLPRVFDVAFRGQAARTPSAAGGGGLGLAIARGLVEAHQGRIDVANADGGCRFVVRLPLPA